MPIRKGNSSSKRRRTRSARSRERRQISRSVQTISSDYVVEEYGNFVKMRDTDGTLYHINRKYPELYIIQDSVTDDEDVIYVGDDRANLKPAIYMSFDDYMSAYKYLFERGKDSPKWEEALKQVWSSM